MAVNIPKSFGALLLGGLNASLLSGFVFVQIVIYFKLYPKDPRQIKSLVLAIWFLDVSHTAFIWSALWSYFINDYGDVEVIDDIQWSLAMTILVTAMLTFLVHLFFAHRIFMLSKRNYLIGAPIVLLAFLRLLSASVTTGEMLSLGTFSRFKHDIRWIFTSGLALSTAVDVLITGCLFALLQSSRTGATNLDAIIDTLICYSFETGALTCAGTVVSMLCWLTMPNNLIFMGLHFVIGKLYANSLLVTLNMREKIRRSSSRRWQDLSIRVHGLENNIHRRTGVSEQLEINPGSPGDSKTSASRSTSKVEVNVNVERGVYLAP
ncbi:hypothetical protein M413DRAFT_248258 [Hebeloma cylindrosporum]|uniref:DUF6534 domain-containing protein n=1 Tax=Hebeloma cylindrosporum TaxID=76867 RepID=A0A0C3BNK1_HEBCY|nr:hypothetical protein M413DRAFT_248258 [Hebeloma cylindrosporum h7]